MRPQREILEDEADFALPYRIAGDALARDMHVAVAGRFQPRDDAQQRGFAATAGPQNGQEFPALDVERDAVEGEVIVESLRNAFDADLLHGEAPRIRD